jgi:hypothetical protein
MQSGAAQYFLKRGQAAREYDLDSDSTPSRKGFNLHDHAMPVKVT